MWPDNGKYLRVTGTIDQGNIWINTPDPIWYHGWFTPKVLSGGRLTLVELSKRTKWDFRKVPPPAWRNSGRWTDAMNEK